MTCLPGIVTAQKQHTTPPMTQGRPRDSVSSLFFFIPKATMVAPENKIMNTLGILLPNVQILNRYSMCPKLF